MIRASTQRRGAILLIVLVLLALFAVIGLAFVLYAQAEATSSRIHREAMNSTAAAPDPTTAINSFLGQLLYPVPESGLAIGSALRGHEMARLAYGYNPNTTNTVAYSGVGLFHENINYGFGVTDHTNVINFTGISSGDITVDPEFYNATRTASQVYNGAARSNASVYIGKNAPYTYPDRNNAYLAMMDPATGRIVMPSFHRPSLSGSLDPSNTALWTNPKGRYTILRPRPFDHKFDSGDGRGVVSDFPYPPPNPDGTITGDVQNMRYADDVQSNDSVWLHANLPPVMYKGRLVQPLVAPLILDLNGRVNFNIAGNANGGTPTNPSHSSHQGFGGYEINPAAVLLNPSTPVNPPAPPNEGTQYPKYRFGNSNNPTSAPFAAAQNTAWFDPTIPNSAFADYSPVDFKGYGSTTPFAYTLTGNQTEPVYPQPGWDNNVPVGSPAAHASLYNPYFLGTSTTSAQGGTALSIFDMRETAYRYSTRQSTYAPPLFGNYGSNSSFYAASPGYSASPNNPRNKTRAESTVVSNTLARAGVMPIYQQGFTANPANYTPYWPTFPDPTTAPAPSLTMPSFNPAATPDDGITDGITGSGYRSIAAALGSLDLNRPLADYRVDTTTPLTSATNIAGMASQSVIANRDRQVFAKDIFDRLVMATGAPCDGYNSVGRPIFTTSVATPGTPGFNTLRYLAQLAVNIVDFIDTDDISTAFVWNPINPPNPITGLPYPEQDPTNFQNQGLTVSPDYIGNHVVFGVEKPRLVINEVYAEATNDPQDAPAAVLFATQPFQVRFFIEIMNPLNKFTNNNGLPSATNTSPLGNTPSGAPGGSAQLNINGNSVYQVLIYKNGEQLRTELFSNPGTSSPLGASPSLVMGYTPATTPNLSVTFPQGTADVEPNNGAGSFTGFRELADSQVINQAGQDSGIYKPTATTQLIQITGSGKNSLSYQLTQNPTTPVAPASITQTITSINNADGTGKHGVQLLRLANPYLPPNPATVMGTPVATSPNNPYIAVDSMWDIKVNDAVRIGSLPNPNQPPVPPNIGTRPPGSPAPLTSRVTHERKGPMYGFRGTTVNATVNQSFAVDRAMPANGTSPPELQSQNTSAPLLAPFQWYFHADRKLITPMELLQVAAVKPYELLHYFVATNDGSNILPNNQNPLQRHTAPWTTSTLGRGLEMLTVKPWIYGVPIGGRQPGKVNVNTMWNQDILNAVLDPQAANNFTPNDVGTAWSNLIASNSPTSTSRTRLFPNISQTTDETSPPVTTPDRPFKSFGVGVFAPNNGPTGSATGSSMNDTLFRSQAPGTLPPILSTLSSTSVSTHAYPQSEMLRKAYNNVTTVSDTYMVIFTIGYFEIRQYSNGVYQQAGVNNRYVPVLGKEVFNEIPGDLRVQYGSIIDRSMMGMSPIPPSSGTAPQQASNVFFSELVAPVDPTASTVSISFRVTGGVNNSYLSVNYENQTVNIHNAGTTLGNDVTTLVLGTGSEAVYVNLTNATITYTGTSAAMGIGTISIPNASFAPMSPLTNTLKGTGTTRKFYAGEAVSSVVLGNPGPQTSFDVTLPAYKQVVPDIVQLKP